MLGACLSGGDIDSMARGGLSYANPCRIELGRWARCTASVRLDLSN